jgi:hypothetical protein
MIIVREILEALMAMSASSLVFVGWTLWRTRRVEDNAASRASSAAGR